VTVLYFADTRFPIERANGTQTMATCHALAGRGHDVTLVVRPDTAPVPRDPFAFYGLSPEPRLTIRRIPGSGGARLGRARFLLAAARLARQPHSTVFTRDLGVAAFLLRWPRRWRPRVVYEAHGVARVVTKELPELLGRPDLAPSRAKLARLARREARVWARADAYVTITQALADELARLYGPRDRLFVVPDGAQIPAGDGDGQPGAPPDGQVVGYAGHLYPWKGVDVLIRALAQLPDARGLIVGGHPAEPDRARIEALAVSLGIDDRVQFVGLVPPSAVAACLTQASVLVLPNTSSAISDRYTSPLKLFEYLAAGRPIVASDLPALREILTDGETALLVRAGDPDALAAALGRLAHDPALAARLAANAREIAPRFSWSERAGRLDVALVAATA
jgi:glycosyltransferase involved in cell wall biosynthesis